MGDRKEVIKLKNIKKCPFCGGDGELIQRYNTRYGNYFVFVSCNLCNAQSKAFNSDIDVSESNWESKACEKAIKAWNMEYKEER